MPLKRFVIFQLPGPHKTCLGGSAEGLSLSVRSHPDTTIHPSLLQAELLLELTSVEALTATNSAGGLEGKAVMWNASALASNLLPPWTIFPSTGLLLPGQRL